MPMDSGLTETIFGVSSGICLKRILIVTVPYGNEEDERAGDQFYNYVTRDFVCRIMRRMGTETGTELFNWFAPERVWKNRWNTTERRLQVGKMHLNRFWKRAAGWQSRRDR